MDVFAFVLFYTNEKASAYLRCHEMLFFDVFILLITRNKASTIYDTTRCFLKQIEYSKQRSRPE